MLDETQAQGLRNALHMTLRDLYTQAGNQQKIMEHLTQMLHENDVAYVGGMKSGSAADDAAEPPIERVRSTCNVNHIAQAPPSNSAWGCA